MQLKNPFKIEFDPHRIFGLDILRAFAILFVVVGHGLFLLPEKTARFVGTHFVLDGVSIFFVLSGFLIGLILIKILDKNKPSVPLLFNFWIRRWFRTLPNYFLVLGLLCLLSFFFKTGFDGGEIKYYLVFLQNFKSPNPAFFSEAWSLCVEEWFYLLIPIAIFTAIRVFRLPVKTAILLIAVSLLAVSFGIRIYRYTHLTVYTNAVWDSIFRKQVITRLDSIMFGVIGACISFYFTSFWTRYRNLFFIAGLLLLLSELIPVNFHLMGKELYMCVFSFTHTSIGTLFLLPFLSQLKGSKGFFYKAFTVISLISYSMYLVNYSLIKQIIMKQVFGYETVTGTGDIILSNLIYYSLSVLIPILIFNYFERPAMNLRERFKK